MLWQEVKPLLSLVNSFFIFSCGSLWDVKRLLVGVCFLLLGFAQENATQLLGKVRTAHGGAVLANLKTYQETAKLLTYAGSAPGARLTVVSYVDFVGSRLRVEYRDGNTLIQILQITPGTAQSWDAQGGTRPLGEEIAKDIQSGLYQSWYGLRFGAEGRDEVKLEGERTFADVKGQAVSVTTKGVQTTYLVNDKYQLIGERYSGSQGQTTVVYDDLRSVGGVWIPFKARIYADGRIFAEAMIQSAKVNAALGANTFRMP